MKIFTIGGSGLVGSRIAQLLNNKYSVTDLSRIKGVDITEASSLDIVKNDTDTEVAVLFSAKADVDGCERDKELGENGDAWKINVGGVQNVVNACLGNNKKLIYISTDFVFDGVNTPENGYAEEDKPSPINWYGETKFRGEEIVKNSGLSFVIARIAYPYRKEFVGKLDFVRAIKNRLENNQPVAGVTDHIFTPTFIDDIAHAIDKLVEMNSTGIFHIVGSQSLTPYDAAILIAEKYGLDKSLISKTTRAQYFKDKAPRPFNVSMNNNKIEKLGVEMKRFEDCLEKIK